MPYYSKGGGEGALYDIGGVKGGQRLNQLLDMLLGKLLVLLALLLVMLPLHLHHDHLDLDQRTLLL
jgi:hypothetical protein